MSGRPYLRRVEDLDPMTDAGDAGPQRFVLLTQSPVHGEWLGHALRPLGRLLPPLFDAAGADALILRHRPDAVFLDFCVASDGVGAMSRALAQRWPGLPVLGLGRTGEPASMLAALRAGVHDFVDMDCSAEDAQSAVAAVLDRLPAHASVPQSQGQTIALLGARAGLGVSTLAANLAVALQEPPRAATKARHAAGLPPHAAGGDAAAAAADDSADAESRSGVALLDLGLPARDGLLYLDADSAFSFVDGVRNLRRLDRTLLNSAMAHHASGVVVLPLPAALAQMREVSHSDCVSLVRRLGEFFSHQVVDLGGFAPMEFAAQVALAADRVYVVCDQSLGAIVSTAALVRELGARGLAPERLQLVINHFEPQAGLSADDIAQRLGLVLAHVLPARRAALLGAASRGEVLVASARTDVYSQSVLAFALSMAAPEGPTATAALAPSRWEAVKARLLGKGRGA